jgi:predicted NAD/FAD-dependent oxidoreductase
VNHISIQSHAQPSYSPSSESLLSVNIIDPEFMSMSDEELTQRVKTSLKPFEIKALDSWKLIAQTPVPKALPSKFACGKQNIDQNGVFVAGDFLETPSIGGAMLSGKRAAERFLDSLSH